MAKILGPNDKIESMCGTLCYIAPEVVNSKPYSKEVDLWAAGMILYVMLRGALPFDEDNATDTVK